MALISTYVFIDLETSGLPKEEHNKTKITEISLIAVKRTHVLDTRAGASPRVQQKITLCLNPGRMIYPSCTKVTGLCNDLLEYEPYFNIEVFTILNTFLNILTKPVCLIAQNGFNFDYPILKNHLVKLGVSFSEDLMCADCFHGFYDILEKRKKAANNLTPLKVEDETETTLKSDIDEVDKKKVDYVSAMKLQNETTPKKSMIKMNSAPKLNRPGIVSKSRRKFPWSEGERPSEKYKLKDIYERLLNRPVVDAHRAENDWLLILTGALWGCTNPFIKEGTTGLREVQAKTRLGQAYAEIAFLLGNWRYVAPWLVNQAGSLVYVCAVQRAPLSLAVPVANSLAFVFTAITGAAMGTEEPLDLRSMFGIVLIGAGTALCCWDKTD